jgi:hypothetical protein
MGKETCPSHGTSTLANGNIQLGGIDILCIIQQDIYPDARLTILDDSIQFCYEGH